MYIPSHFAEHDLGKLHAFIEAHSFATVVSCGGAEPDVSHLPLLLDRERGPQGRLIGHMAKANRQWRDADGRPMLVVFHGPHAYISPAWYEAGNAVPTWNYVAVHVYGTLRMDDSRERREEIVQQFVRRYEGGSEAPWSIGDADAEFTDRLLDAIVGFTIEIERIEGKWKLGQNHDADRRRKVVGALRRCGDEGSLRIAELMAATLEA